MNHLGNECVMRRGARREILGNPIRQGGPGGCKKREAGWERSGRRIHRGRVPGAKTRAGFEKERAVKSAIGNGVVK